ncbi:hypothetical protein BGX26_006633 [Mortierella sp. AD094]|nr:hypothetical protein BGX26_006633 [Mortierella sp. AD094]
MLGYEARVVPDNTRAHTTRAGNMDRASLIGLDEDQRDLVMSSTICQERTTDDNARPTNIMLSRGYGEIYGRVNVRTDANVDGLPLHDAFFRSIRMRLVLTSQPENKNQVPETRCTGSAPLARTVNRLLARLKRILSGNADRLLVRSITHGYMFDAWSTSVIH